jgi:hypothetical protein
MFNRQVIGIQPEINPAVIVRYPLNCGSESDPDDGSGSQARSNRSAPEGEDLPYKVELWDEGRKAVEQVLAVTANGSIGYAAYYAATREFADRYITLRHKNRIVSRWNGPNN